MKKIINKIMSLEGMIVIGIILFGLVIPLGVVRVVDQQSVCIEDVRSSCTDDHLQCQAKICIECRALCGQP